MPSYITTNIAALNAQNLLAQRNSTLSSQLQGLSASARIKIPTTDRAAELIAQQEAARAAAAATNNTIAKAQIDEGTLGDASTILNRMREVVLVAYDTSTYGANSEAMNEELTGLKDELARYAGTAAGDTLNKSYETESGNSYHVLGSAAGQGSREISISASTTADDYKDMLSAIDSMKSDVSTARGVAGETIIGLQRSQTEALKQSAVKSGLAVQNITDVDTSAAIELAKKAKEALEASRLSLSNMFSNSAHANIMALLR